MIETQNVCYEVGNTQILSGIDVTVKPGKLLAILGPNGSGKSTLMKVLSRTIDPHKGQVFLNGKELRDYSIEDLAKIRAVLSQSNPISFPFTAHEIVMMGRSPHMADRAAADSDQIVDEILVRLECEHLKDRLFFTLSGGEQQRIQFARVLAQVWDQKQAYLFLDEPTSALDMKQQLNIVNLAKEFSTDRGFGVCLILHDLNLAKLYADDAVVLKNGQTVASGACGDVLTAEIVADAFDVPIEYAANQTTR